MTTAAAQFAALPELVALVAHHVFYSRDMFLLGRMCQVNRTFYAAASPYAFRELRIDNTLASTRVKRWQKTKLWLVKEVFFSSYKNLPAEEDSLKYLLSQLSRLESFEYDGAPLTSEVVQALARRCPRLASLTLGLRSGPLAFAEEQPDHDLRLEVGRLRGLRELTLHHLPNNHYGWWLPQLVSLLQNSPGLRKLRLGFTLFCPQPSQDAQIRQEMEGRYIYALDRLCELYGRTGASSLRLHSLELLEGTYPLSVDSLKNLTDLSCLHDVYTANILPLGYSVPVAWAAFGPPHAPNLRHLRVDRYTAAVHRHFCAVGESDPSFVRRLGVFAKSMEPPFSTAALLRPSPDHPSLPLQVRMLDIDLALRRRSAEPQAEALRTAEQALEDVVSSNADSLEGLAVNLPAREEDDEEPNVQLLERALAKLPSLTQLSAHWQGLPHQNAAAERFALAGPRLRFINIGRSFWRVWRKDNGTVKLTVIKTREADRVELWRYSRVNMTPLSVNEIYF
jgi:hypothetical protein